MRIDSINIESFGKLKNFRMEFDDGFNIVYGGNEAGKSTIMAFVEMMFYGKTTQEKSADIGKSLRKKYMPWDGFAMCGELEFTHGERQYRIRKVFKKTVKTDETELYDARTGEKLELGREEEIGRRFFDLDVGSFEKSVYISGFGGFASQGQTNENIAVKLSNLVTTMDEDISQSVVIGRLSGARERLRSKNGKKGVIAELEQQKEEIQEELSKSVRLLEQQAGQREKQGKLEEMLAGYTAWRDRKKDRQKAEECRLSEEQAKKHFLEWSALFEEWNRLEQQKTDFSGTNYTFETAVRYVERADELKRELYAKQHAAEKLTPGVEQDGVVVDKQDVVKAKGLERKKEQLAILRERISSTYRPALEECLNAVSAEERSKKALENISPVPKKKLWTGCVFCVLALLCGFGAFFLQKYLLAGLALFGELGAVLLFGYARDCVKHEEQLTECHEAVAQRTKDRLEKESRLGIEKERLIEKGGGIYPDRNCNFEAITYKNYIECCSGLNGIYGRYGVDGLEALEQIADSRDENRLKRQMYDKALEDSKKAKEAYEAYTKGADPEIIRNRYNRLKEEEAALRGKLELKGIMADGLPEALVNRQKESRLQAEQFRRKYEEFLARADKEPFQGTGVSEEMSEIQELSVEELEERIADIREQLTELASLLKTPERDPQELEKSLDELERELREKQELYEAIALAEENMQASVDDIGRSFGPMLNEKTAAVFERLTGGKYENASVDKEYAIQVREGTGTYRDWRFLSSATTDQAYLALRLAMTELITDGRERLPLLLDDVLLQYDEERTGYAVDCLAEYGQGGQVIFFTCRRALADRAEFKKFKNKFMEI